MDTCRAQNERKLRTLGELSLELETCVPFILQYGVMPSSVQLLEAGRPDLVQAIKACNAIVIPLMSQGNNIVVACMLQALEPDPRPSPFACVSPPGQRPT